jgi:hypothetical protein
LLSTDILKLILPTPSTSIQISLSVGIMKVTYSAILVVGLLTSSVIGGPIAINPFKRVALPEDASVDTIATRGS